VGGKLRTEEFAGSRVESGADSFLTRDPGILELCDELGLTDELVAPAVFKGAIWDGRRAYEPVPGVMGIPTGAASVLRAKALSPAGKARALADLVLPGPLTGPDVSVAEFLTKRFGQEVLDRSVDPILGGTRAGAADDMSLAAALPQVDRAARANRSVMKGLAVEATPALPGRPLFLTPRGGMTWLPEVLAASVPQLDLQKGVEVLGIRREGDGYSVVTGSGQHRADGVVVTVPSPAAARLLEEVAPSAAAHLAQIQHASVAVVALSFEADALQLPTGTSGFLVPSSAGRTLAAATWWSAKWPHTRGAAEEVVVRCFVGRAGRHPALALSDEKLAAAAAADLSRFLGSSASPSGFKITRWEDSMPQYRVGHLDLVGKVEAALAQRPGLVVAGADLRGSGIPDCVRQGSEAARLVHRAVRDAALR
jgi:oxygen-dependent protoporphyrinogen oxidase